MAELPAALAAVKERLARGEAAAALIAVEEWLQAHPEDFSAHILRVNAANALGDLSRLIDGLRALLRLRPQHPQFRRMLATAENNRGAGLREQGRASAALECFQSALALDPAHPQAWFNLALCLHDLKQPEAARAALKRHLALCPADQSAQRLLASWLPAKALGEALRQSGTAELAALDPGWLAHSAAQAGLAEATVEALARLQPDHDLGLAAQALCELRVRAEVAAVEAGSRYVIDAARRAGKLALRAEITAALTLPAIYRDREDLHAHRRRFADNLARLAERWSKLAIAGHDMRLRELQHSNFLLAYQGLPDRPLQQAYARLIEPLARQMRPDLVEPPTATTPRRVGLLSSHWRTCTVGAYFGSWIEWLSRAGFEVFLYQLGPQRDGTTERLARHAHTFRFLQGTLETIAETIRGDTLDLLLYPELGMDDRLLPLAALRLARRQAVAWGHPTTTGLTTMDAYFSCAEMEPEGAVEHYSEPLLLLPGLGVDYLRPDPPHPAKPEDFGLDPRRPRVLVPQSLFKLHPDTDQVLIAIAADLPEVEFVLFEPEHSRWRQQFETRLRRVGQGVLDPSHHLRFLPLQPRQRYLQVNLVCDVMLDSLHWSGGNTAIDALGCGLPVVACPGHLMRGRQSLAMLRRLDLADALCTQDAAHQARRIIELLRTPSEREDLRAEIVRALPNLFEAEAARRTLVEGVGRLIESRCR